MTRKVRNYHHGDLRATLIQATLLLVRQKGPRGFTLNEASRAAGVSVSAPYNHFKDKEGLLIEVVLLGNRTLESELRAAAKSAGTAQEQLLAVFLAYIVFAKHHPELFAVMFQSGVDKTAYPDVQSSAAKAFAVAGELCAQIELIPAQAQELAFAVWTMAHGFATLSAEGLLASVKGDEEKLAEALARRLITQPNVLTATKFP